MTACATGGALSGEYIFEPNYGAGIPQKIGEVIDQNAWRALIIQQMFLEDSVARTPAPVIQFNVSLPSTVYITIQYINASTGLPITLSFDANG